MSTIKQNERTVRELYDALNRHDLTSMLGAVSNHIEFRDNATGEIMRGKEAFGQYFLHWLTAFRDGNGEIQELFSSENRVIIEVLARGTQTGPFITPFGRLEPTGRTFEFRFCQIFHLKDGKIIAAHSYYDASALVRELTTKSPNISVA